MTSTRWWALVAAVALVAGDGEAAPAAPSAAQVAATVQKLYDGTTDFTASFEQEYVMVALNRTQRSKGRVAFRKPQVIRFDYVEPQPKTFAVEGSTLWIFQPEDKQVLKNPCFKADGMTASLVFLGGTGKILEQFDVSLETGDASHHALRLVPKTAQGSFRSILLWVDKKSGEVRRTEVEDGTGNPNRFVFSEVRRNKGVADAQVRFTPPPDAAVQVLPGSCPAP